MKIIADDMVCDLCGRDEKRLACVYDMAMKFQSDKIFICRYCALTIAEFLNPDREPYPFLYEEDTQNAKNG